MTTDPPRCPRCLDLAAEADHQRLVAVTCVACSVTVWVPNPVPGAPYAGCIACYRASAQVRG